METPVGRRAPPSNAPASQLQAVLHGASLHPPPKTAVDAAAVCSAGVAPELMAASDQLDLAILCTDNTIRATSLLDLPVRDQSRNSSNYSGRRGAKEADADPFHRVAFDIECAPRPGDDTIPSAAIPAKASIKGMQFSPAGSSLLIWGESYVAVARLPRTAARVGGSFSRTPSRGGDCHGGGTPLSARKAGGGALDGGGRCDGGAEGRWTWTLVDMSGYAVDVMRQRVVQATWHPVSDDCVTLLTVTKDEGSAAASGAVERAFVMLHVPGRARPEQVVPIPDGPSKSLPVAIAHGSGSSWQRVTIFIARKDGSIAALCPFLPKNARIDSEELLELWAVTCDKLVAARVERSSSGAMKQDALDAEVAHLEQQQEWLRETFGDVLEEEENVNYQGVTTGDTKARSMAGRHTTDGRPSRHIVVQDEVVAGRGSVSNTVASHDAYSDEKKARDVGPACGLVVLRDAGSGDARIAAAAPPPTVLAVAYRAGLLDLILLPTGISPRWSDRAGTRVTCALSEGFQACPGAILESLDLAERSPDKSSGRQGLALSAGGEAAWTLLAATPCRLTAITVTWAVRIEKAMKHARERAAGPRSGAISSQRLDGDLRAALRERPDSDLTELLSVPPSARTVMLAVTPVAKPVVGNLVLSRLASGKVELVNLAVVTQQATEAASAAKRAREHETPSRGDMLPPFEAALEMAEAALDARRRENPVPPQVGQLRMSELDRKGVRVFQKKAEGFVEGGIVVLEKLHLKTSTRLQTLCEIYEHQAGLIGERAKEARRLKIDREEVADYIEEIKQNADEQRDISAAALAAIQESRPEVSPAERIFVTEMKDMENYADRVQAMIEPAAKQVEELRLAESEAEEYLLRAAEASQASGGGLSESDTQDMWNMLKADRERILELSRRMKRAKERLTALGVEEEEGEE